MKILLIIDQDQNLEYFRNTLYSLTEGNQVIFLHSIAEGENFIRNRILSEQLELDLLIIQDKWLQKTKKGAEFIDRLVRSSIETYSNRDFNFKSLPFLILFSTDENDEFKEAYLKDESFQESQFIGQPEKLELYLPDIVQTIKNWRKKLLDELSNLGIEYRQGFLEYQTIQQGMKMNYPTEILSNNFKLIRRNLNYVWLNQNNDQIEQSIDQFIKELKSSERSKQKEEKKFHRFFKKYPLFLSRDIYNNSWYEPRLNYVTTDGQKRYIEPDFILKRNFRKETDLSIIEIKLPSEGFITNSNFHPSPFSKLINHLFQISDYKDYLENEKHSETIKNYFGYKPIKFDYNLLIGRDELKEKVDKVLEHRLNQMHMDYIKIITYDNLLELQVRFLHRLKILEIK